LGRRSEVRSVGQCRQVAGVVGGDCANLRGGDAGEGGAETRTARASAVLKSVLDRVPGDNVRFTAAGLPGSTV
jgi:hypothetical protein